MHRFLDLRLEGNEAAAAAFFVLDINQHILDLRLEVVEAKLVGWHVNEAAAGGRHELLQ